MKIVVDKMPEKPHHCLFARNGRTYVCGRVYDYVCSIDGATCYVGNSNECLYLKEEQHASEKE